MAGGWNGQWNISWKSDARINPKMVWLGRRQWMIHNSLRPGFPSSQFRSIWTITLQFPAMAAQYSLRDYEIRILFASSSAFLEYLPAQTLLTNLLLLCNFNSSPHFKAQCVFTPLSYNLPSWRLLHSPPSLPPARRLPSRRVAAPRVPSTRSRSPSPSSVPQLLPSEVY